jgi:hypothetical protein
VLVFYVGYILDEKNTLCNSCILTGWSVPFLNLQVIWTNVYFKPCLKFLENVHEDSMRIPRQLNWFLCNRSDGPLKASGCPTMSRSFSVEDVRKSGQHRPDDRSSFSNFYTELDFS